MIVDRHPSFYIFTTELQNGLFSLTSMVYYFTSFNVKQLRKISQDYAQNTNCPPSEYMTRYVYVDRSPDSVDEEKLSWIVDTFLDLQKHRPFLRDVCSKVDSDLSLAEKEYLVIILYATIFQISPSDKEHLYRSIFNLGKTLMRRFSTVFSNNEIIPFISQLARAHYDDDFVTKKIITPLFSWQPYISDMSHDFEYNLQRNSRVKNPAPVNILDKVYRPGKHVTNPTAEVVSSTNAPKKKMLTKSVIDLRLQQISQQNKERAAKLLSEVKALEFGFAKNKSAKSDTVANVRKEKSRPNSAVSKIPKTKADKENIIKRVRKTPGIE